MSKDEVSCWLYRRRRIDDRWGCQVRSLSIVKSGDAVVEQLRAELGRANRTVGKALGVDARMHVIV